MLADQFFTLRTDYTINYTTKNPVPIPDIIASLKNIEKLIHRTPAFIEKAYSGIKVVEVIVYVDSLQAGSLKEKFIIDYVFKGQANYDKAKEVFDHMVKDNTAVRTVVALGVGGLITYGVMQALGSSNPSTHVTAYNNTIINVGADAKLSGEDLALILSTVKDKKQLAEQAIGAVKPAKSDPDSTIEMQGMNELTIDKNYIRDTPDEYVAPLPDEKDEKYSDIALVIYASDREKSDSTWAGTVPGLIEKRTKFVLADGVEPEKLHGKTRIYANVTVTSQYNRTKRKYEPKVVMIHSYTTRKDS